jgi:hypothetical protein
MVLLIAVPCFLVLLSELVLRFYLLYLDDNKRFKKLLLDGRGILLVSGHWSDCPSKRLHCTAPGRNLVFHPIIISIFFIRTRALHLAEVAVQWGAHDDGAGDHNQPHHHQDVDQVVLQGVPPGSTQLSYMKTQGLGTVPAPFLNLLS